MILLLPYNAQTLLIHFIYIATINNNKETESAWCPYIELFFLYDLVSHEGDIGSFDLYGNYYTKVCNKISGDRECFGFIHLEKKNVLYVCLSAYYVKSTGIGNFINNQVIAVGKPQGSLGNYIYHMTLCGAPIMLLLIQNKMGFTYFQVFVYF